MERKRRRLVEEEVHAITTAAFQAYGWPPEVVNSFNCLGRVLTASKNDWPVVVKNLIWERKRWVQFLSIFGWEGANSWTSINFPRQ